MWMCGVCDRTLVTLQQKKLPKEATDWLISERHSRCPRHITDWSLRQAGVPRRIATWQWAKDARHRDELRWPTLPTWWPYPIPMDAVIKSVQRD